MTKTAVPKQTLYSLQFLRAIAVLLVVFSHIRHKQDVAAPLGYQWLDWFSIGEYGVDIFFVISGFIIAYISPEGRRNALDVLNFMMRRIIRIMPLYYTVTLIALAVWLVRPEMVNSSAPEMTVILPSFFLWPTEGRFLFQTGWTLSYEMYFYFLFGLTLFLGALQYRVLAAYLALSVLAGVLFQFRQPVLALMTNHHLAEFLAGYVFFKMASGQIGRHVRLGLALIAMGSALIISHIFMQGSVLSPLYHWGIPAMMLVFGFLLSEGAFKIPPLFLKMGDSSYSIYLTHALVLPVLTKAWYAIFPQTALGNLGFVVYGLVATIVIGFISYRFYEIPVGKTLNSWWKGKYLALKNRQSKVSSSLQAS